MKYTIILFLYATPVLNNHLSLPLQEVWRALALLEGKTLGAVLRGRRRDLSGTPGFLSVAAMGQHLIEKFGEDLGRTGAWISNLEHDRAKLIKLLPEVRLELLKLYRLTDEELARLDERFGLGLPLQKTVYLNNSGSDSSTSAMVWFTDVLNAEAGERLPVPRTFLESKGVDEKDCEAILITDGILMPESIRAVFPSGMFLVCTPKADIKASSTLVYRCGEKYALLPNGMRHNRVPVMNADGSEGNFVGQDDDRLEFLGVSIARIYPDE